MESSILLIQSLSFRKNGQSQSDILLNSVGVRQEAFSFLTFSSNTSINSAAVSFCPASIQLLSNFVYNLYLQLTYFQKKCNPPILRSR